MAGAEGLEPSRTVLETAMLPLHHAPLFLQQKLLYLKTEDLSIAYPEFSQRKCRTTIHLGQKGGKKKRGDWTRLL